ncbi:MAG: nucleotidyl transferase AbiEii/AbiGii toxin family protein, partial [Verrucomicrobiae bacterium]|nr:nucleotidyl transferase AbiEii/AbiGii toxin family protein [Verrucomicrobiae bacterium]
TAADWENALREIVQELALLGLWRSKFYEHAAFYGGTALRIFHSLPRYSEDLDFSLLKTSPDFDLSSHLEAVRAELASFGFAFEVERKVKRTETAIDSAFIKGNTRVNLLEIGVPEGLENRFPAGQKLKIKMELDTDPPQGAEYEVQTLLLPIPFQVKLFTPSCLFAGKMHALLCRNWKGRVKGRDFYDFIWYLGKGIPVHLSHLQKRMEQTGHWDGNAALDEDKLKSLLRTRFAGIDFDQAKGDVLPFVQDADAVMLWGQNFFLGLIDRLKVN